MSRGIVHRCVDSWFFRLTPGFTTGETVDSGVISECGKTRFMVAYDYGMGGLWGLVWARSPEELHALYPDLAIVSARPEWMTDELFTQMEAKETYDIDDAPRGMLSAVLEARLHD